MKKSVLKSLSQIPANDARFKHLPEDTRKSHILNVPKLSPVDLENIDNLLRNSLFFKERLKQNEAKFNEILSCIVPFAQIIDYKMGQVLAFTGRVTTHINFLMKGEVHLFVPMDNNAYLQSVKLLNPKSKKKNVIKPKVILPMPVLYHRRPTDQFQFLKSQVAEELIWQATTQKTKHKYWRTLKEIEKETLKISAFPTKWKNKDIYDNCIAICKTNATCVRIPIEVYIAIQDFIDEVKRRDHMKVLLSLFGDILPYQQLAKYIDQQNATKRYKDKQQIPIQDEIYYLILDGQIETLAVQHNNQIRAQENEYMQNKIKISLHLLSHSYKGDMIGCEEISGIVCRSRKTSRILKFDKTILEGHFHNHSSLKQRINRLTLSRRLLLLKVLEAKQSVSQGSFQAATPSRTLAVKDKRDVDELELIDDLKANKIHTRSLSNHIIGLKGQVTQQNNRVSVVLQSDRKGGLLRKKFIDEHDKEAKIYTKLGLLSQYQITEHNGRLTQRRGSLELMKYRSATPKKQLGLLPQVPLFSKRCQNLLNCNL